MQSRSLITKSLNPLRIDEYYQTTKGTVIVNGITKDITVVLNSSDTMFGSNSLEFAKSEVGFDDNLPTKIQNISWVG